jgi:hypothetical protein
MTRKQARIELKNAPATLLGTEGSGQQALQRTLNVAVARKDRHISTLHLLVGLLQADIGTVPRALAVADRVVAQPHGRSTQASMTAVAKWLEVTRLKRVILVSDPFHMFRLRLEARRTRLDAHTSPTESSPISDNPVLELRYLAAEALKIPIALIRAAVSL